MKFLTAEWKHLLFANYLVTPEKLEAFLPSKTKFDFFSGQLFISLVAFLFDSTKVMGVPIPFHGKFEEVNLRFYVVPERDPSIRAVTFVKEIVPKVTIPIVANNLFHERYVCMSMDHSNREGKHWYSWQNNVQNRFRISIERSLEYPQEGSLSEFITEHYWGYSKAPGYTLEYQVEHPQWRCCEIDDYDIAVKFAETYGEEFSFLDDTQPHTVMYAEGSSVSVSFPRRV